MKVKKISLKKVINTYPLSFGDKRDYKKGDICVWRGGFPCICRIKGSGAGDWSGCFEATLKSHNSMYYSNLRLATKEEAELLKGKEIILLK